MARPVHRRRRLSRDRRDPHFLLIAENRVTKRRSKLHRPVGDVLLTMRERADALSQGQQRVDALARRAKVSPPTIIRFCRALGFAGLREFKLHLAQSLAVGTSTLHRAVVPGDNMQTVTHKVLQGAASALANLEQHISPDDVERAVTRIAKARRVDCYAVGNTSMFMASDAQARFSRLGLHSNFYFDAHLQLVSAATMNRNDVALAISHIGRMPFLLETVDVAKEQGAMIIAITRPDTPLAKRADIVLPVVVPADPSMRVGTEAYLAQMAYIEILMVGTGLRRGPPALRQLKRVRQVLQERGVDSETHPVLERAWSKGELQLS
ncbi:MAG: MurR/RpiR family transcriptional regulator [Betaproteobacteria bacterium]|nr:MAG: MurR/RpiR family transcriptional regulator [Betaproteobacteria bacterium]